MLSGLEKIRSKPALEIQRDGKKIIVIHDCAKAGKWFSSVWNNVFWLVKVERIVAKYYRLGVDAGKYVMNKWS